MSGNLSSSANYRGKKCFSHLKDVANQRALEELVSVMGIFY